MILITGGAGYIGSHTVLTFLKSGFKVIVFDSLEKGHIEIIETLKKEGDLSFIKGDLKNYNEIKNVFKQFKIDTVIHFAGYIEVEESVREPKKYYNNNVIGTRNLLNAMIENDIKKIIFSSTCAVYGNPKYLPIDEQHPRNPISPYGENKLEIENMIENYDKKYGIKSVILRYFNVIGADSGAKIGEWHNPESHLIPNILKSVLNEKQIFKIYGNDYNTPDGTCIRDYVNVEDMAEAHKCAYEYLMKNNKSEIFNIGTTQGYSVKEVLETVEKITAKKINCEIVDKRQGDCEKLTSNTKKANRILGWQSKKTLDDSIKSAFTWEKILQNKI